MALWSCCRDVTKSPKILPARQGARMFMRPFFTTVSLLAAWCWFFRREAEGSRVMALLAALFFGATAIVMVLSMQVSDWYYPAFYTIGYLLWALPFRVYAIWGRER